ncbi:NAD(P)H-dependent oxidoreductase [Sphingobacterium sp. ML3W]|uniref:FMN-dependent NADH-azoreductase n=1 Tax=Sphingobacterium sp. ML3W TaxID=1538644 RepID=UPI00249C470D|nr:NAD(P)H-dependent oxidoreductase [Sphingobacterium sp. ML3W]WFA81069.1 NAD(P)H-dependent oxidoreductase [Sphingobacterium sp. ML3W]
MKTILRIDSSLRIKGSYSRTMGDYFVELWKIKHSNGKIIERDINLQMIPHLTQDTVNGFFDSAVSSEILALSDQLIEELYSNDELLITCPMYNYGIPSSLKAYFDLIVRTEKTFTNDSNGIRGLLTDKKAYIISAMGMTQPAAEEKNLIEIQITRILNQLGIVDINYFPVDGTINPEQAIMKLEQQRKRIYQNFTHAALNSQIHNPGYL